jgi:hypothetical protein
MRRLIILLALPIAACAPQIVGNEGGGIIKNHGWEQTKEFNMADAWCRKYGKHAQMKGANVVDATQRFECTT